MARYTYSGLVQTIPLKTGTRKNDDGKEVSKFEDFDFKPGKVTADLPDTHPIILSMIETELLTPVVAPKADPKSKGDK
jgi:hypothetical protein